MYILNSIQTTEFSIKKRKGNFMKKAILTVLLLVITIATVPLISVAIGNDSTGTPLLTSATTDSKEKQTEEINKATETQSTEGGKENATEATSIADKYSFKIYDKATKKIITVSDFEFCCGSLATETESDIPFEALKAQAVAIHTYYSYLRNESRSKNKEYDFECNSNIWETYVTQDELKEKWRDTFEDSYGTIKKAVSEVSDTFILYDDKLCMTKYFEISSGVTYSYNEIYGKDIPYLISSPSPFDTVANNYKTSVNLTPDEFNKAITEKYSDYNPDDDFKKNIDNIVKSENGATLSLTVGNIEIKGSDFANILNLRSTTFDIACKNDKYVITVYGYGENIGMSKFGACRMAEQGSSYLEILQHYYSNTEIVKGYAPY